MEITITDSQIIKLANYSQYFKKLRNFSNKTLYKIYFPINHKYLNIKPILIDILSINQPKYIINNELFLILWVNIEFLEPGFTYNVIWEHFWNIFLNTINYELNDIKIILLNIYLAYYAKIFPPNIDLQQHLVCNYDVLINTLLKQEYLSNSQIDFIIKALIINRKNKIINLNTLNKDFENENVLIKLSKLSNHPNLPKYLESHSNISKLYIAGGCLVNLFLNIPFTNTTDIDIWIVGGTYKDKIDLWYNTLNNICTNINSPYIISIKGCVTTITPELPQCPIQIILSHYLSIKQVINRFDFTYVQCFMDSSSSGMTIECLSSWRNMETHKNLIKHDYTNIRIAKTINKGFKINSISNPDKFINSFEWCKYSEKFIYEKNHNRRKYLISYLYQTDKVYTELKELTNSKILPVYNEYNFCNTLNKDKYEGLYQLPNSFIMTTPKLYLVSNQNDYDPLILNLYGCYHDKDNYRKYEKLIRNEENYIYRFALQLLKRNDLSHQSSLIKLGDNVCDLHLWYSNKFKIVNSEISKLYSHSLVEITLKCSSFKIINDKIILIWLATEAYVFPIN